MSLYEYLCKALELKRGAVLRRFGGYIKLSNFLAVDIRCVFDIKLRNELVFLCRYNEILVFKA